jgi:hypothetical protein
MEIHFVGDLQRPLSTDLQQNVTIEPQVKPIDVSVPATAETTSTKYIKPSTKRWTVIFSRLYIPAQ